MGMCRLMGPQDILRIEPRGVWGRKRIVHIWVFFECEIWFKMDLLLYSPQRSAIHLSCLDLLFFT